MTRTAMPLGSSGWLIARAAIAMAFQIWQNELLDHMTFFISADQRLLSILLQPMTDSL